MNNKECNISVIKRGSIADIQDIAEDLRSAAEKDTDAAELYLEVTQRLRFDEMLTQIDEDEWTPKCK